MKIANAGKREGAEVVQLYVHDLNPQIDKPVRELKGFSKIFLSPGEKGMVTFTLKPRDLAHFDVVGHGWRADAGKFEIEIGASSRDIRLKSELRLVAPFTESVFPASDVAQK